ncbi:MAG: hypothetical protein JWQ42_236, partial [Edaphobacter sp.]|nr:hypothetical protein [Edaphobacter sp.]
RCICTDQIADSFSWLDGDGVFVGVELSLPVLQFTPYSMQVDRMFHHGVVDENEACALSQLQLNRFGVGEFLAVEANRCLPVKFTGR